MTKELKNAVSRLRKLQDAAIAGKIDSYEAVIVCLSFYCRHFEGKDRADIDVSVSTFDEDGNHKQIYWEMTDDGCVENGKGSSNEVYSHAEFLQYVAQFIDYPV